MPGDRGQFSETWAVLYPLKKGKRKWRASSRSDSFPDSSKATTAVSRIETAGHARACTLCPRSPAWRDLTDTLAGLPGGSVASASDSISAQVMISQFVAQAQVGLCKDSGSLLGNQSLLLCPSPARAGVCALSQNKYTSKKKHQLAKTEKDRYKRLSLLTTAEAGNANVHPWRAVQFIHHSTSREYRVLSSRRVRVASGHTVKLQVTTTPTAA